MVVGAERVGIRPIAGAQQRSIADRLPGRAVVDEPVHGFHVGVGKSTERLPACERDDAEEEADRE